MHTHCVVYRTGGTDNFKWHRSLAMSMEQAQKATEDTRRMGYAAILTPYVESVATGLPQTYDAK